MKCPKCGRYMEKITNAEYLTSGVYFYKCNHCNFISELMKDDEPLGDNQPLLPNYTSEDLKNWRWNKRGRKEKELKKEHKKIEDNMRKKYGKLTDDDWADLLIELWEHNQKCKKKGRKKNDT